MKRWFTHLGLVAGCIALPALGFTVAESLLGKREQMLEDKISEQAAEIAELRELFKKIRKPVEVVPQSRRENQSDTPVLESEDPGNPGPATANPGLPNPAPVDVYDVYLSTGNSTPLFNGALTLSLDSTQFAMSPPGYRASFVLRAPGSPEKQVPRALGEHSLEYAGFHVVLDRVEPTGAGFIVSRLPS